LLVAADGLRIVLTLALLVLALTASPGTGPVLTMAALAFLLGSAEVLRDNTAQTFVPTVVDRTQLERANGSLWAGEQLAGQFVGPPLAGVLIGVSVALPFGVHAGLLAIEGLHALDGSLASVDTLFAHGFRMMGLTHFFDNEVAASAHGVTHAGLTPLGRQVIARMEALGIVVDLAHASPQTITEVLAMATRPVVVSHTGVAATCPGPRNLTDDQLRAISANGGVVGIGYWDAAVCTLGAVSIAKAIRHAVNVAGIDHVGLGSDFDGATATPFATDGLAEITQALLDQQFTPEEIGKVMGGNVMRLLRAGLPQ
jgi:hypothetical protein